MGRMRRQRKYKACDPFNKANMQGRGLKLNDKYDKPLSKSESNDDYHFAESSQFKKFQQFIDIGASGKVTKAKRTEKIVKGKKGRTGGKEKMKKIVEASQRLPGESKKEMFWRLDQNIQEATNEAMKENKTIRKKRKEHLKARDEKLKAKKSRTVETKQITKDFDSLKDDVKFGETALAPPSLTVAPRKAQKKEKTLQLHSLLKKNDKDLVANGNVDTTDKLKRRRDMNDVEKEKFDEDRQRVIDAYRLAKKRREMRVT